MWERIKGRIKDWYKGYVTYLTVTPVLVAGAIIVASFIVGSATARNLENVQTQAVEKQMRENLLLIENTFASYEQMVWSEIGRINSAPVDRASWNAFVDTYRLSENFPAISRLAVTRIVRPEERESYLAQLSQQYGQEITIKSAAADRIVNILSYSSPERQTTLNNIGYNVLSDRSRAVAVEKSTDTNSVVMTDQLELLLNASNNQTEEGAAFLMYAPYYRQGAPLDTVEQRRDAVQGHAFASFRTEKVFEQIFKNVDKNHVAISIAPVGTSGNKNVVYKTEPTAAKTQRIYRSQEIQVNSQKFAVDYEFDRNFLVSTTQLNAPLYTALFGSFVGILVGTVTFFFLRGRYHQVLLDTERDIARAKDELLSLASHQLRTPATGVKQYMGMVLQGFAGTIKPNQEELLTKAYKSNERQLRVINDILHLAKLDLGRIVLAKTRFDLSELIKDVADEQEQEIISSRLTLSLKTLKSAPIYADKHMLRMVIENLLSNAIKYTDPGGKVSVELTRQDKEYFITIEDTGVGIDEDDIQLLFKQFSRLRNSRSHLVTGTGVGLYLAKHLTQLHDGDITVESKLGEGSSFIIIIPKNSQKL